MSHHQSSKTPPTRTIRVFISYAREDSKFRDELLKHLSSLKQQGLIESWTDSDISPGTDWEHAIEVELDLAQVILLLISADFLKLVGYNSGTKMHKVMQRHYAGEAYVVPIILRPVDWDGFIFSQLEALPGGAQAVTLWKNKDDAFLNIARGIKKLVTALSTRFLVEASELIDLQGTSLQKLPPLWNVPYRRNLFFTAREDILLNLHTAFASPLPGDAQSQAIYGLGGIGKSQIALEYCYRYSSDYQAVFWVKADLYENLAVDFVAIANLLNLPKHNVSDQHLIIAAVKRWLQDNGQWLLVLDNIEDVTILDEFIPPVYKGHILITTRAYALGGLAKGTEIVQMQPQEGALLLLRRAKLLAIDTQELPTTNNSTKAQEIATLVDGLPLALDQAGAYIEETQTNLSDYTKMYRKHQTALLKRRGKFDVDHPLSVSATFQLALAKIERTKTRALDILHLSAFLHPDAIAEELFTDEDARAEAPLPAIVEDVFELNEAIEELLKFSLIRRSPEQKVLSIHPLVQAVIKEQLPDEQQQRLITRAVSGIAHLFPDANFGNWALCKRYLPQALLCIEHIEQGKIETAEAAQLVSHVGLYLLEHAFYAEAEALLQQSLTLREHIFGAEHPETARGMNDLSGIYRLRGRYPEAEQMVLKALVVREKVLGADHLDTATSLNYLGLLYQEQGKYEQAEPLYIRALGIREKVLRAGHPTIAQSLHNLASLYRSKALFEKAEPLYQRALAIREQALGLEHPDTARSLNSLGLFYKNQAKYAQAEPLYQKALAIRERILEPQHPNIASSLNNLASLYQAQGKYVEAEPLYKKTLAIDEYVFGAENPETALSLSNLAQCYRAQGRYQEAEPLYLRSLAIREQLLGNEHPSTAQSLHNLAELYRLEGRLAEAEPLFKKALAIREKILGAEHPDRAQNLHDLSRLYITQKNYAETELLVRQALSIRAKVLGIEHPDTAQSLHTLAELEQAQGKYKEAEAFYQQALAIYQALSGNEHPEAIAVLRNYIALLYIMKRDDEASALQNSMHLI